MLVNELITVGMRVVVMGLGVSGRAAVRYLLKCGAVVAVSDSRSLKDLTVEEREFLEGNNVSYEGGGHSLSFLQQAEMIVVSPGIPRRLQVLEEMRRSGVPVLGELALAGPAIKVPVVAITGTNGKTTVTSLIGEMLAKAGREVFVGGNIGTPLFDFLSDGRHADVVVLEVSSFQLENSGDFRPDVALMLNVTPDHLNWHGSMESYREAKARIFLNQDSGDAAILCGDDPNCRMVMDGFLQGFQRTPLTFGYGEGCSARIYGDCIDLIWQNEKHSYDLTSTSLANHIGRLNGGAAILALVALEVRPEAIEKGLREFSPPPHRMEWVLELSGITYINDSKATNTGAVLSGLEQIENQAVLIAGGRDKGEDYSLLRETIERKVRQLVLIGEAAGKIGEQLQGTAPVAYAGSMEEAVQLASKTAEMGDTVLLSPACASFDMFDSYGHRGEVFTSSVHGLTEESVN